MTILLLPISILLLLALVHPAEMVKREDFKTCKQSGFCTRQQAYAHLVDNKATLNATYSLVPSSLKYDATKISAQLMGIDPTDVYNVDFLFQQNINAVRLKIAERNPLFPRHSVADYALSPSFLKDTIKPSQSLFKIISETPNKDVRVVFGNNNTLAISYNPFRFEIAHNDIPLITFNERGYFYYEVYRNKDDASKNPLFANGTDDPSATSGVPLWKRDVVAGLWEESFNGKADTKPRGGYRSYSTD
jgi:mannosyl-oligosaccharide alpha-1,3-glucosidase